MKELNNTDSTSQVLSMTEDFWDTATSSEKSEKKYAVNVKDNPKSYKIEVSAPGFKRKDFEIVADNGKLTVSAESNTLKNENTENYIRKEFSNASFKGCFLLPKDVLEDHISAKYQKGIFTINLKKSDQGLLLKKRRIKIH